MKKHLISFFAQSLLIVVLVLGLGFGLPKLHGLWTTSVEKIVTNFKAIEDSIANEIYIGEKLITTCPEGSWMIMVQASDPKSIMLLEGNPNIGLTAVTHKAPSEFFSGCKFVRVTPSGAGTGDWKVNISSH